MPVSKTRKARKATLIAFGVVALAALSCSADPEPNNNGAAELKVNGPTDTASEAARAYKQALTTLSYITSHTHVSPSDSYSNPQNSGYPTSFFSAVLPNIQGQGPIASAMRIVMKLRHQSWVPSFVTEYLGKELGGGRKRDEEMHGKAVKVLDLLQHAAELGHSDALYTLAKISLVPPNHHFPFDPTLAYHAYSSHASTTGNATSQMLLAFFHSTGYQHAVPVDQAKAQLYLTFAAHGGHKGAQMALGYRYWSGIGVADDCMAALGWYEQAAEQAMAKFLSGPPGGRTLPLVPPRLSDLEGGVYGFGASVASTGFNAQRAVIKTANARAAGETWEDLLEYYSFNADRGEVDFAYRLGKIFYQGSIYPALGGIASGGDGASSIPRDFHAARYYFLRIARQVWKTDPPNPRSPHVPTARDQSSTQAYAALAAGYLGRMHLRGEGVRPDAALAKMWFERGADFGEKESHNGLGIIWRDGLVDGKRDAKKSLAHFGAAANQELAEAQVNLGKYAYSRGDFKLATASFETAIRQGSPFEAYYYLADIQGRQAKMLSGSASAELAGSSCAIAVSFYKLVAERGTWDEDLLRDAERSWGVGTQRGREMAMLGWWLAAERGYEVAQNNLAYVLDQDKSILRYTRFAPSSISNDTARLALTQWTRSAAQHNIDALVKVGDYYYHGLGVPSSSSPSSSSSSSTERFEKAAGYYQSAADTQMSALAMWNLGYMYEHGIGVPQDFHLAKRHYDNALETNAEAYIPVTLALVKLHARSLWYALFGGPENMNLWHYSEEDEYRTVDPEPAEIDDGGVDEGMEGRPVDDDYARDEEDGQWYLGKARDDYRRRHNQPAGSLGSDDDPVQWARDRRQAENDRDGDFGPEDYFEGAMRGGHRLGGEEDGDEFGETMLLVFLCLLVSGLIYVRGRWVERVRREEQERVQHAQEMAQAQAQQANGVAAQQGHEPPQQAPAPAPAEGQAAYRPPAGARAEDEWMVR